MDGKVERVCLLVASYVATKKVLDVCPEIPAVL